MSRTVLEPVQTYLSPERKRRLLKIVDATERRMTMSKLVDEAVAEMLPRLEVKYGVLKGPAQDPHGKRKSAA